ncbi:hypothetical protein CA984_16790 [Streptosporangium minutum]|uniref:Uncharacterized protein n=1 Tax=Streptosporangium minutum TaxID=569862 RepID=A0A2C9ZM60_9ACTN|nr:hypothetical protein CA984_16790 [Streptosporangium minutum]
MNLTGCRSASTEPASPIFPRSGGRPPPERPASEVAAMIAGVVRPGTGMTAVSAGGCPSPAGPHPI